MPEFHVTIDGWWPTDPGGHASMSSYPVERDGELLGDERHRLHKRFVQHRGGNAPQLRALLATMAQFEDDRGVGCEDALHMEIKIERQTDG